MPFRCREQVSAQGDAALTVTRNMPTSTERRSDLRRRRRGSLRSAVSMFPLVQGRADRLGAIGVLVRDDAVEPADALCPCQPAHDRARFTRVLVGGEYLTAITLVQIRFATQNGSISLHDTSWRRPPHWTMANPRRSSFRNVRPAVTTWTIATKRHTPKNATATHPARTPDRPAQMPTATKPRHARMSHTCGCYPRRHRLSSRAQHPDEHRPKRPILPAVDQELGGGAALWRTPEPSDPVGSLEVGEHQATWSSSARGAGPSASRRAWSRRSTSSGRTGEARQRLDIRAYAVYTTSNVSTEIGFGILTWLGARPTSPTARSLVLKTSSVSHRVTETPLPDGRSRQKYAPLNPGIALRVPRSCS
jgi:hypothetical protein